MANKINFSARGAPTRTLKVVPDKYRQSPGRPNISISDGIRPAFPLMPFRHLPAAYMDITTGDNVVIPKGRIVSAITSNNGTIGSTPLADNTYYGVPKGIMGLMVPANKGVARQVTSPYDSSTPTMPANKPIGVAEHDVYQDVNGTNLNYDMRSRNYGILSRQLIKLPCIDIEAFDTYMDAFADMTGTDDFFCDTSEGAPEVALSTSANYGYHAVEDKYSWLTIDGDTGEKGIAGQTLMSDFYGNFQLGTTAGQVVGHLLGIDYRFEKDLLDTVQNPYQADPSYRVSGTGTFGIPQFLFDFAYAVMVEVAIKGSTTMAAIAATEEKDQGKLVAEAVEAGAFGEAWIQLNL